jgi:glyoxylase-like metal-dependent hydrolase (beta-lactamase superfamily II)
MTARAFQNRPNTFKAQGEETGANWESIPGLGSVRWAPPEISFVHTLTLHWGGGPVLLESHPGPASGAIWVILPEEKIVFVGDAVLKGQPPFLAHADLPAWLEALQRLQSADFKGYTIVSGRSGIVTPQTVRVQADLLEKIQEKIETLSAKRSVTPAHTDKLAETLLKEFKAPAARQKQYLQRLRFGLRNYLARHYPSLGFTAIDE